MLEDHRSNLARFRYRYERRRVRNRIDTRKGRQMARGGDAHYNRRASQSIRSSLERWKLPDAVWHRASTWSLTSRAKLVRSFGAVYGTDWYTVEKLGVCAITCRLFSSPSWSAGCTRSPHSWGVPGLHRRYGLSPERPCMRSIIAGGLYPPPYSMHRRFIIIPGCFRFIIAGGLYPPSL